MAPSARGVKVDLGAVSTVAEIKIYWGGSAWGYLPAEAYNVYVSADDSTYDLAFSYEGILSAGATYDGKFVTEAGSLGGGAWRVTATETGLNIENVRYIKIEILGWKYRAAIREIEVVVAGEAVDYTVKYVDQDGNHITNAIEKTYVVGETITQTAPEFEGYKLLSDKTVSIVLDRDSANEINFVYKKLAAVDYTIKYVDEEGNSVADAVVKSNYETLTATETAVDLRGYELVSEKTASIVLDKDAVNEIIFTYKKLPDIEYTVKFVDEEGNELLPSKAGVIDAPYDVTVESAYIEGYYRPAPITITLTESDNVIEFVYEAFPERMVNSVENLLANATVTTTGHDSNKNSKPEHLIDNDNATFSQANWTKNPNYTAIIDLHGNYDIDNISLLWCGGTTNKWDTTNGGTRATKYTIAVSVDGTEYTTVYTYDDVARSDSRDNITVADFAATPKGVRYVKINFTEAYLTGRATLYEVDINGYAVCDRVISAPDASLYAEGSRIVRFPFTVMTLDNIDPITYFAAENWILGNCTVEVTTKEVSDPASSYYTWEIDVKVIPTNATATVSMNLDLPDSYMMTDGFSYYLEPSYALFDSSIATGQNAIKIDKNDFLLNYNGDGTLTDASAKRENRSITMSLQVQSIIADALPYRGYDDVIIELKEFRTKGDRVRFYLDEFVRDGDYYNTTLIVIKPGVDQLEAVIGIYGVDANGNKVELDTRTITSDIITIEAKYPEPKTKAQTVKDYTFPMDVLDQLIEKVHPADLPTYTDDEWAFYEEILVARGWKAAYAKTEIERVRNALDEAKAVLDDPNWVPTKEYAEDTVTIINGYYTANSSDYKRMIRMGTEVWNYLASLDIDSFSVYGPIERPASKYSEGFEDHVQDAYITFRRGIDYEKGDKFADNNGFCIRMKFVAASAEYSNVQLGKAYDAVRRVLGDDQLSPIIFRLDWYNWGYNPFSGGEITIKIREDWYYSYANNCVSIYRITGYKYSTDEDPTLTMMKKYYVIEDSLTREVKVSIKGASQLYDSYVIVNTNKPVSSLDPNAKDFAYDIKDGEAVIEGYAGLSKEVEIPSKIEGYPVTTIAAGAFANRDDITTVIIPDSITTIGSSAFSDCSALTSIVIPDKVTTIGSSAFYMCSALTEITIPNSVTTIGDQAFVYCTSLTDVIYIGTHEQREAISIGKRNTSLTTTTWHYFSGICDSTCSDCDLTREVPDHSYDDALDEFCNKCNTKRFVLTESSPRFVVSNASALAGDTFTVEVYTKNNVGLVSLKLKLAYDANILELVSIEEKDFADVFFGPITKNPVTMLWEDVLSPNNMIDGTVAVLTFKVKEAATAGDTAITLTYDPDDVYDENFENVTFATEEGVITIIEYISGDVNGDRVVNNKDLGMLRQHLNGWDVTVDERAADVTRDGKVNNKDLGILRQYLNGWDVVLK